MIVRSSMTRASAAEAEVVHLRSEVERLDGELARSKAEVERLEKALKNERQWTIAFAGDVKAEMDRADVAEVKLKYLGKA